MKHRKPTPSPDLLRELFDYHPDGHLLWRATSKRAGSTHGLYLGITIKGSKYYAHRLIWSWHHGDLGVEFDVDHINGNKRDNRIENLQLLSHRANSIKGFSSDLPTGVHRNGSGFYAQAYVDGKRCYLGQFSSVSDASDAYRAKVAEKPVKLCMAQGDSSPRMAMIETSTKEHHP